MLFSKDKFALSADAMKVVAKALAVPDEMGGTPRAAVMAGMRNDNEPRFCFADRFEKGAKTPEAWTNIYKSMKFISGDTGAGKTHLMRTWAQLAAEKGYRSLSLSKEPPRGWADEDISTFDAPASPDEVVAVCDRIRDALTRGEASHIHFSMGPYATQNALYRSVVHRVVDDFVWDGREDILFTVDDFDWREEVPLLYKVSDYASVARFQFATTTRRTADLPAERFAVRPSEIRMLSTHREDDHHAGHNRHDLERGQFLLGDESEKTYRTPKDLGTPGASRLPEFSLRAIARLERAKRERPMETHTERLEAVARACGYRSWHAAQGRAKKT